MLLVTSSNNDPNRAGRRARTQQPSVLVSLLAPLGVALAGLVLWQTLCSLGMIPETMFPTPAAVWRAFGEEISTGRMWRDTLASLMRVGLGFGLAVVLGIPLGLWLGHSPLGRAALLPGVNFFRCLSPLAWIPFAVFWFGVGHAPAIFLIFMASFFPLVLATMAAVASIPVVYFRVAHDFDIRGIELLRRVTLAAIAPEIVTSLRVTAGLAWVVVVAAEMLAGREGLGFAVMDARNGLRADLLVVEMIAIGTIGVALDRALMLLTLLPSVRWGYER
jgi:NitT/TauT family transport system permease protein